MLFRMFDQIPKLGFTFYDTVLFQAVFLFAFYFVPRVSEFTAYRHNIQLHQLDISHKLLKLTFLSFKHSTNQPETHSFASIISLFCTVNALLRYLEYRGNSAGPLFMLHGKPISNQFFSSVLKKVVNALGLAHVNIKSHSFRIGAASYWAEKGFSEVQIQKMGRWHSNAMISYFRGEVKHNTF